MLDPQLQAALDFVNANPGPTVSTGPIETVRSLYIEAAALLDPTPPEVKEVSTFTIPGPRGEIPARSYVPVGTSHGVLVWFHGGGWVIGDLESHDAAMRRLSAESSLTVVGVEYRLAPEHPFPASSDDAVAALQWVAGHSEQFLATSDAVGVGGDSAGANLALIAAALTPTPQPLAVLAPCYPALGPGIETASLTQFNDGYGLSKVEMDTFYDLYLGPNPDLADPRISPLSRLDLSGLPPTELVVCGYDPLRDEGLLLGAALVAAGVQAHVVIEEDQLHGFIRLAGISASSARAISAFAGRVAAHFRPPQGA